MIFGEIQSAIQGAMLPLCEDQPIQLYSKADKRIKAVYRRTNEMILTTNEMIITKKNCR